MTSERFDLAVLGGGCAGLSLAVQLAERSGGLRVVVLEARESYERDRTWCSWAVEPHRFSACVTHRWNRWSVRHAGEAVEHASPRVAYEHLPADAFYAAALSALDRAADVELRTGVAVGAVTDEGLSVRVRTDRGDLFADRVVDTRPPRGPLPRRALLQHFGGLHVRTRGTPFDPAVVTLMDFDVPQDRGLHFAYVLPFAPDEALVESTFLTREPFAPEVYERAVRDHLAQRFGTEATEVRWSERGAIPMAGRRRERGGSPRVLRAGGAAGAVRPSSGYAFLNIQRAAVELARRLVEDEVPETPAPRSRLLGALDRVFLEFLSRRPERAPAAFAGLFRAVGPEPLARFLMERGRVADHLRVVAAMPKLQFVRAALAAGLP